MDYDRLIEKIEEAKAKKAKAEGRLEQRLEELQSKFGVKSLEEAKSLLLEVEAEVEKSQKKLDQEGAKFMEKWGGSL